MKTSTLETPFTPLQAEILKVCNKRVTDEQLIEIKNLIGKYFMNKAVESASKAAEEKGYTDETYKQWLEANSDKKEK